MDVNPAPSPPPLTPPTPSRNSGKTIGVITMIGVVAIAVAGIIIDYVSPSKNNSRQISHDSAAMSEVGAISTAQSVYAVTKGKGKFTDLKTLCSEGLVDRDLLSGEELGYRFETTPVNLPGMAPMFDTTAIPISTETPGGPNRSFGSNETRIIYVANGAVALKGTPTNRKPVGGTAIQ